MALFAEDELPNSVLEASRLVNLVNSGLVSLNLVELDALPERVVEQFIMIKGLQSQVVSAKNNMRSRSR